jgi:hypothetical protein
MAYKVMLKGLAQYKNEFYTPKQLKCNIQIGFEKPPFQVTAFKKFPIRRHTFIASPPPSERNFTASARNVLREPYSAERILSQIAEHINPSKCGKD